MVDRVEIDGNVCKIYIFTKPILCVHPITQKIHELGQYKIEIDGECKDFGIRWFNLTRTVNTPQQGMQAPNVNPDGSGCSLNDFLTIIPELIGRNDFFTLTMIAIEYLQRIREGDNSTIKNLLAWPIQEKIA